MIEERRKISKNPELILKIHKYLESKCNHALFSRSVDLEVIKFLIKRKEFQKAEEEIARMVLKKEYSVLYDHALIKIEQKQYNEAKELLKRMKLLCSENSIEYFKATVKLCEIGQSRSLFEGGIEDLERATNRKDTGSIELAYKKLKSNSSLGSFSSIRDEKDTSDKKVDKNIVDIPFSEFTEQIQKLYFLTAKYFEKHDVLISVKYYFKSFISNHEAIPRFFHLISSVSNAHMNIIEEMIEIIKAEYLSNLIPFYNQISTKLSLENTSILRFYKEIITAMLEKYPYQTHWNTLFLFNSKKTVVSNTLSEIIENLSLERRKLFGDIKNCSEKFTNIAKRSGTKLSMENFPEIRDMFPAQVNIPGQLTEINNIKNEILVFRSLQTPKKIILIGEDGKEYPMIVKFKDDLRKDSRFMDLDNLLNNLFDDNYYVRRYNVIPFNHESGIIEFVPNLFNLKEIIHSYQEIPHETIQKFLRTKMIGANNMAPLMEKFKPVYNRYLKETYPEPYQFYRCRENYIRTYAIMNIVGWFMGLGDRHSENIHFDRKTGDTVHVDLNCIFDKAKSLEIPEKVPFRLTQNIVDGFGILKLEGTYKHTLKHTLEVLRDNRDVIQANLLSFVFDPLFEWAKKRTEPVKIIEGMNEKLDFEDVDFKIEELISEATDVKNLGSMYIGWMAFI